MYAIKHSLLAIGMLAAGANALAQDVVPWSVVPERESAPAMGLSDRDALGLPGMRPRLTMTIPLDGQDSGIADSQPAGAFSWSLETWQLNTASLAHIQCASGRLTVDSYLAQDCRFVDQPLPEHSISLVHVRGDWMATRGLSVGMGAFHGQSEISPTSVLHGSMIQQFEPGPDMVFGTGLQPSAVEGLDFNVSFGLQTERIGDFLVGLQLARYRQRMSLADLGLPLERWNVGVDTPYYSNSAQLMLGWRRGNFSGEMLGHHRDVPMWLGAEGATGAMNSFDLEFSWQALRNASISFGVSNVLDTAPQPEDLGSEGRLDDPMESIYGRIPYVRYKHDL